MTANFTANFLYTLDQNGNSTNGKVLSLVPNSASTDVGSGSSNTVITVGETFGVTFSDPTTNTAFGGTYTFVGWETNGDGVIGQNAGGNYFLFSNDGSVPIGSNLNTFSSTPFTVCYALGTLIRTPHGDVPVETLRAGDLVLTASGEKRPVKWIGHANIDFRLMPNASPGQPIRIVTDAFGPGRPSQDLYLSAGHSVCVDLLGEVFILIGDLVNGSTIAQVGTDKIGYWHIELDSHDVLIANNLPAESYLAMGNRGGFSEAGGLPPAIAEGRDRTHADFCRPVVRGGPTLDFVRSRLATRAEAIGWTPSFDPELRLAVDGKVLRPLAEGGVAVFLFPADARDVRLVSNTFVPNAFGAGDRRSLGLKLTGLSFSGGSGEPRRICVDDRRLCEGVYSVEERAGTSWRWTTGELVLDPQLWAGLEGGVSVLVSHQSKVTRKWNAPEKPQIRQTTARPRLVAVS